MHVRFTDIQSKLPLLVLAVACLVTFGGLLYLTSYLNFYYDEWDFVTAYRPSQTTSIFMSHNEHWSTIPVLIWKVLFLVVGLRVHWPYEAAALLAHVACVGMLFVLVRRHSGDFLALGAALVLLVLGPGSTDILWAFEIGFTLAIAFGLLALVLVDGIAATTDWRRAAAIVGSLLLSLMSSGIGLGFLAAVTTQLLVDRERRRYLALVVIPLAAYLLWFSTLGAGTLKSDFPFHDVGYFVDVVAFVGLSLRASADGLASLIAPWDPAAAILLAALLSWHWYERRRVEGWELGLVAGLVAQFTLIGLTRVRFGLNWASDPRYVYVGVVYLLPLVANAVKTLPWRGSWRVVLIVAFGLMLVPNAFVLASRTQDQTELMRYQNAELRIVEMFRGSPEMALNRQLDPLSMPQLTASKYLAAIDELGSPVPASTPKSLADLPENAAGRELVVLFGDAVTATPTSGDGTLCQSTGPVLNFNVPNGQSIQFRASSGGVAHISLGYLEPPAEVLKVNLSPNTTIRVRVPDTGRPIVWELRIQCP